MLQALIPLCKICRNITVPYILVAESYAPFLSMAARESFLVVPDTLVAAPGPGQYSLGFAFDKAKGGGALNNKVCVV